MGSVGDCYDNALCESFFATLECELLDRVTFATPAEARAAVFDFIEGWYNTHRHHSALGYESPLSFEQRQRRHAGNAAPMEAAGPVDAKTASTSPLENVLRTFPTAPTRRSSRYTHHEVTESANPATRSGQAQWWVTNQKSGVSALGLQRALGLGSYKTAWTWLHKLHRAMVPGRDRLTGHVEVDETHWGAAEAGAWGRRKLNKVLIAVAVEQVGRRGLGRIRMRQIPDASADSLQAFVGEAITPGSLIHTDGWLGYDQLEQSGDGHHITFVKGQRKSAADLLPRVQQVVSLLKRWLLGTHHGAVSFDHLDYYLDEFTFRFNRRTSRSRAASSSIGSCSKLLRWSQSPTRTSSCPTTTCRGHLNQVNT